MAEIRLERVHKRYENGFHAVKGIDLHILDREFMVLVGPSGCGKTSTLRMIAGLEEITSGEVSLGMRRINDIEPADRDLAFVFQNYALYPHMTVAENMGYALRLRGLHRAEIALKVEEAARLLGIAELLPRRPRQLSGGQRQRVALGRAIVRSPKAFLFDEPLSNLDAQLRAEMRFELKRLQHHLATTMVYVTHDQIEAMTLGDRITVMHQGEIQQVGPPMQVYERPWNRFVAGFLGSPSMNFLPAVVATPEGGEAALQLAGGATLPLGLLPEPARRPELAGKAVALGLRPEHLAPAPSGDDPPPPGWARLAARVEHLEPMGDHQFAYVALAGSTALRSPLVMKLAAEARCEAGAELRIQLNLARAQLFDGAGEQARNLSLPADFPQVAPGILR
jgi:ABC-type sugar transport system ATPase subunit